MGGLGFSGLELELALAVDLDLDLSEVVVMGG